MADYDKFERHLSDFYVHRERSKFLMSTGEPKKGVEEDSKPAYRILDETEKAAEAMETLIISSDGLNSFIGKKQIQYCRDLKRKVSDERQQLKKMHDEYEPPEEKTKTPEVAQSRRKKSWYNISWK